VKRAGSLLAPIIHQLGIADGVRLAALKRDWPLLFQDPLPFHMSPSHLSNGELAIAVDSPAWLQELSFSREMLLKKLEPYAVRSIRFRLGRVSDKPSKAGRSQTSQIRKLTQKESSVVEEMVSGIGDDGLKGAVKTVLEKAVATGRTRIREE
jgi:hypothetical protein